MFTCFRNVSLDVLGLTSSDNWATFVRQRHLSDTEITAVGQMSLSDKYPDRRHLSESGVISFSQAWCRAGIVACTSIPMLQEGVIS